MSPIRNSTLLEPSESVMMEPPRFLRPLHPQVVPEGEPAILEAEVMANPEAQFKWFKHGYEIHPNDELEVTITSENNKTSLIMGELLDTAFSPCSIFFQEKKASLCLFNPFFVCVKFQFLG